MGKYILLTIVLMIMSGVIVWLVMNLKIRKQHEEIKKAREEAQRASAAKTRFLANISHEIRTPINTIMGMNEMAIREDAEGVPKDYFRSMMNYASNIQNASEYLSALINDLLDMSKIENGTVGLNMQEYDMGDMLGAVVSMIRMRSSEKGITFDISFDEILPRRLYGDQGKLQQILLNLLTNAVKYTQAGGILFSVFMSERDGDTCKLRFSVKDTDELFSVYERLEELQNNEIEGTGSGLEISKRFAELMGGSLIGESTAGKGSEFILTVNQRIVDETPLGAFQEYDESHVNDRYVPQFIAPDADVLVVDDDPMTLNIIKGFLKGTKVFVSTAAGGEECLKKIKETSFHIVLLNHMLPGMDGAETIAGIRRENPELPVYALTDDTVLGEEFYKVKGYNGYLMKPIDSRNLEKTIMRHLPEEMMEKPQGRDE